MNQDMGPDDQDSEYEYKDYQRAEWKPQDF